MGSLTGCGNNEGENQTDPALAVNNAAANPIVEENETTSNNQVVENEAADEAEENPSGETAVDETITTDEAIERVPEPGGMNLGNIANSGFWTFQGPEIFYTAGHDLGIYNLETQQVSKLDYHGGHHKYIVGNDLYFSHITGVRKADLRTGDYVQLTNTTASYINVYEDWIYFVNYREDDKVYRMKTDGSNIQELSSLESVRILLQHDGYLYFTPYSEYNKLYRMKLDGSDLVMINDQWVPFFMIYDDKLYMSQHGEYGIYQSALDGSGKSKLTDYYGDYFNIVNDHIFYSNSVENYQFYRMNLDGSENQLWLDQRVNYMCVNDDYLYFFNDKDPDLGVVRMHYDSRELEVMDLPRTF
jgi:hypothetical protein